MTRLNAPETNEFGGKTVQEKILYYPNTILNFSGDPDVSYTIFHIYDFVGSSKLEGDVGFAASVSRQGQSTVGELSNVNQKELDPYNRSRISENEAKNLRLKVNENINRLDRVIALPMPKQLIHPLRVGISQDSESLISSLSETVLGGTESVTNSAIAATKKLIQSKLANSSTAARDLLVRRQGLVENERREAFFTGTEFRQFDFNYVLSPRNEAEAEEIQKIIKTFRYYMLPSFSGSSFFLVQPAEFKIKFMVGGQENRSIPRIDNCILQGCNVNYSPKDTWNSIRGSGGFPTEILLTLSFIEKQTMFREKIEEPGSQAGDTFSGGY